MKIKKFALLLCLALCACCLPANASSLGDIRVNARFLTDRMAFELNLNQSQYNDLFEINFDFLSGVDPYLTGMACADAAALDAYYRYLDERNDDLRWILSSSAYTRFLAIEYFFRPIYAMNNVCYLRVYKVYPNRSFFYFGRPVHYLTYHGAHSRRFYRNTGYYCAHYTGRNSLYSGKNGITVRIIPVVIIIRCIKVISTLVRSSENMTLSLLGRLRIPDIILLRHDLQLRQHPLIVLRHVRHIVRV